MFFFFYSAVCAVVNSSVSNSNNLASEKPFFVFNAGLKGVSVELFVSCKFQLNEKKFKHSALLIK